MASTLHPFVKVTLDKERHLNYGAAAFIEFKERTGIDLLQHMRSLADKFTKLAPQAQNVTLDGHETTAQLTIPDTFEIPFKDVRDILWAGLIWEDPDLTPMEVSNMFDLHNLNAIIPKIMEAFTLAMPKAEKQNPRKPQPKTSLKSIGA